MPDDVEMPEDGEQSEEQANGEPPRDETAEDETPADDEATAKTEATAETEDEPTAEAEPAPVAEATQDGPAAEADEATAEQAAEDGAGDAPTGAGLPPELRDAIGDDAGALLPLASQAAEVLRVAVESATDAQAQIHDVSVQLTDYEAIQQEFTAIEHVGFELRVALSETEAQLAAALLPLADAGSLLSLDLSAEQMADEEFAKAQLEAAGASTRELLDLVSLTLFSGGLSDGEVTLTEARHGQIDWTMGMLQDVAQGAPPARIDFSLVLADERVVRVTVVIPTSLLARMAELLAAATATEAGPVPLDPAPTPGEAEAPPGFGLSDEALGNVTQFPGPAADEGAPGAGGSFGIDPDIPVHPLRFPPLPESEPATTLTRPIDLIMDVTMRVTVELGRSSMSVEEVLQLGPGSVVELNKLAGEPVDILVNDRLIARGEVVVVDENFGVRVTEIVSPLQRATAVGH